MFQHRTSLVARVFVAVVLTAGFAAAVEEKEEKKAAWHVKEAEIRVPVTVVLKHALLRMPPQVYVADLKPLEITGGLAFDPKTKSAIRRDVRKPEEKRTCIVRPPPTGVMDRHRCRRRRA